MQELPTIGLTDEQHALVWSKIPGENDAEKVAWFQEWLTGQVRHMALAFVRQEAGGLADAQVSQAVEQAASELP